MIDRLYKRYNTLQQGHAFEVNTPFRTIHDNHDTFISPDRVSIDRNAVNNFMAGSNANLSAPFAASSYEASPHSDGRVYAGTYTDSTTGIEYHMWEEAMPERETDESLQPSHEAMDRMLEVFSGGLNNDEAITHMGVPNFKPEENNMAPVMTPEDTMRKRFGNWDALRSYADRRATEESARRMENNFEGINEKEGGPSGSLGIHSMAYTKNYNHVPVSAAEMHDKGRISNPSSQVQLPGMWAKPTQITRQENFSTWNSVGTGGHVFGMREINEMPGDREARSKPPQFLQGMQQQQQHQPAVQLVFM